MSGPLSHLTVLDLSRVLAGPWCTQLLADLGATVIKIERPGSGDDTRAWGPPFLRDGSGRDTSEAAYYLSCNRGKLSVAVDFTTPDGQRIVRDLARQADVLVENYKVGGLEKYGLDYPAVAAANPRARLRVDHRLRAERPVRGPRRLRFHHPGHVRVHERHRRARRSSRRRTAESRHRDHRPDDGHVHHGGHPGRARASRPHGAGTVDRHLPVRFGRRDDGGDESQLSRDRQTPGARRQRAPEHRSVPGVRLRRRPPHSRDRQRQPVRQSSARRRTVARGQSTGASRRMPTGCAIARSSCRLSPR